MVNFPPGTAILRILRRGRLPALGRRSCSARALFLERDGHIDIRLDVGRARRAAGEQRGDERDPGAHASFDIKFDVHDGCAAGFAMTRTESPAAMASPGLAITRSVPLSPEATSTVVPKSRPKVMACRDTWPASLTTATWTAFGRNSSVFTGTDRRG